MGRLHRRGKGGCVAWVGHAGLCIHNYGVGGIYIKELWTR